MAKFIIQYEREGCIGAAACVGANDKNWVLNPMDSKADLIGGAQNTDGLWEKEIDESQLELALVEAKACPVLIIHVINKDTGEKLF